MTTEQPITVSLEWARKLKEAGYPQDTCIFGYMYDQFHRDADPYLTDTSHPDFAAPSAEEILRRLPKSIATKNRKIHRLSINCNGGKRWQIYYGVDYFDNPLDLLEPDASLANAAAAMYCYLSDNSLLP